LGRGSRKQQAHCSSRGLGRKVCCGWQSGSCGSCPSVPWRKRHAGPRSLHHLLRSQQPARRAAGRRRVSPHRQGGRRARDHPGRKQGVRCTSPHVAAAPRRRLRRAAVQQGDGGGAGEARATLQRMAAASRRRAASRGAAAVLRQVQHMRRHLAISSRDKGQRCAAVAAASRRLLRVQGVVLRLQAVPDCFRRWVRTALLRSRRRGCPVPAICLLVLLLLLLLLSGGLLPPSTLKMLRLRLLLLLVPCRGCAAGPAWPALRGFLQLPPLAGAGWTPAALPVITTAACTTSDQGSACP
jgi:hypothetical protein